VSSLDEERESCDDVRVPHRLSTVPVLAVLACAALCGGCGSSGGSGRHGGDNGEASKVPARIVADAAAALRAAHGYRMRGTIMQSGQTTTFSIATSSSRSLTFSMATNGKSFDLTLTPTGSFLRASPAFWARETNPVIASRVGNRWIVFPVNQAAKLTSQLGDLSPAHLAYCLSHSPHGKITVGGRTTVDGQPVIALHDDGNAPGDHPSTLDIATTGTPYPLRIAATGTQRPGGLVVCSSSGSADGTITLRDFGHVPPIQAPAKPLDLTDVGA
jgi:hypothetical protein